MTILSYNSTHYRRNFPICEYKKADKILLEEEKEGKMTSILIFIIYLAFISLGLPDSLLGSAWPVIHTNISVPLSYSGIVFMIISFGTVVSSLNSDRLIRKIGTGKVTAFSTLTTVIALMGFSFSRNFISMCFWAIPYGLGAGSIDAALNNYVALHYASRHMSWLHCMWGVGATIGPVIMSFALTSSHDWHLGYRYVGLIQFALMTVLFLSLPLWKERKQDPERSGVSLSLSEVLRIKGVIEMMVTFFCYCALEQSTGLWASSWLVNCKGIDPDTAARFASLFFTGITLGRAISGFITFRFNDRQMVHLGFAIICCGLFCLLQSLSDKVCLIGLVLIGLGCAPVYPSLIHSVPERFGQDNSQAVIGVQMASAYVGTSLMAPLFGVIVKMIDISAFPFTI